MFLVVLFLGSLQFPNGPFQGGIFIVALFVFLLCKVSLSSVFSFNNYVSLRYILLSWVSELLTLLAIRSFLAVLLYLSDFVVDELGAFM